MPNFGNLSLEPTQPFTIEALSKDPAYQEWLAKKVMQRELLTQLKTEITHLKKGNIATPALLFLYSRLVAIISQSSDHLSVLFVLRNLKKFFIKEQKKPIKIKEYHRRPKVKYNYS